MDNIFRKIHKLLLVVEGILAGAFLLIMTFCVFLQVFTRYIFHFSYSWPEELARFCFIWTSMVGACVALERKKLHDIDIIFNLLPPNFRTFLVFLVRFLVAGILSILVVYGFLLTKLVHAQVSPAMEIPMSYVYFAVPFASFLMLVSYCCDIIQGFVQLRSPTKKVDAS